MESLSQLNKYALVRGHFLMVTKGGWRSSCSTKCRPTVKDWPSRHKSYLELLEYQSQSAPLTPADLLQTYLLMLNANLTCGRPYFSFFNCGAKSGASQPHKHVQFLPTLQGFGGPPVERVARSIKLGNECTSFVPAESLNPLFRLPLSCD